MTADPTTTLAAHIWRDQDHGTIAGIAYCCCGWTKDNAGDRNGQRLAHARHVLSVLSATHAIIELPEPQGDDGVNVAWEHASMWHGQNVVTAHVPSGIRDMTPENARAVAADLLAAARQAGEEGQ